MNTKKNYTTPMAKTSQFQYEGTILISSVISTLSTGIGADVKFENESDFDSFFN